MATAYLHGLKKSDLSELASASKLPDYESMKKADLESALDEHLRANQSAYEGNKALSDYYKRLGSRSPVKKEKDVGLTSGDEAPVVKKARRKTIKAGEDAAATASSTAETVSAKAASLMKTPSRQSLSRVAERLPATPAAVSDMVERQTSRLRTSVSKVYASSGIHEKVDDTRAALSSAYAVQLVFVALESFGLFAKIVPFKPVAQIPAGGKTIPVTLPDFFVVLKKEFWIPLSLWAVTSHILPALVAYFFNIAHSAAQTPGRRSTTKAHQTIDPLVFYLMKAILVVAVYYNHYDLFGWTDDKTIDTVTTSQMGGEKTFLAGSLIGAVLSIYEAILKK